MSHGLDVKGADGLANNKRKQSLKGKELRDWRKSLGWTQAGAARWFDVPLRTYQEWEQDRSEPAQAGPLKKLMAQAPAKPPR